MKWLFTALTAALLSCNTAAPVSDDWRITIATDGGFSGRGIGGATVDAKTVATTGSRVCNAELTAKERESLSRAVAAARPAQWQREYAEPGAPYGHPDQIRYTLTLEQGGGVGVSTSWHGEQAKEVPEDVAALFRGAWDARARALAGCK